MPFLRLLLPLCLLLLASCAPELDSGSDCGGQRCDIGNGEFSLYTPGNRFGWGGQDEYLDEIQPILAKRCVACHGCSDSPCQLKLSSFEGVLRGSNENNNFAPSVLAQDPNRIKDGRVTREDGTVDYEATMQEWRDSDYYGVVEQDSGSSLMSKLLFIANDISRDPGLFSETHELYAEHMKVRDFECVGAQAAQSAEVSAARAMPFGMQPLAPGDFEKVVDWISRGAPGPDQRSQVILRSPKSAGPIENWEDFLNGAVGDTRDEKRALMARYLFEHMFFAHIEFDGNKGEFYEIVRSRSPQGTAIDEVVTELIMDDPGEDIFYRFRKIDAVMVRKTHTVWDLDPKVMQHWDELFLEGKTGAGTIAYEVDEDPGYTTLTGNGSRNPFRYFSPIPGQIRAQFMIENSKRLIDSLVKADVCTGSTATYAIRDHFWVWFLDPASDPSAVEADAVAAGPIFWNLNPYAHHAALETEDEEDYQENFEREMRGMHPNGLGLNDIWVGEGNEPDPNSWLTVLRHSTSATVEWGAVGGQPDTGWLLSYSNFERMYYNLTVNFLNWNGAVDQLQTWTYFSNVRTEAEDLMVSLFPADERVRVRSDWTRGFDNDALFDFVGAVKQGTLYSLETGLGITFSRRESELNFAAPNPGFRDLTALMASERLRTPGYGELLNSNNSPAQEIGEISSFTDFEAGLNALTGSVADYSKNLPNITQFRVTADSGETAYYSIIANRGYSSNDFAFGEARARSCDADYVSAFKGIVGNYPELFVDLPLSRASEFLRDVQGVRNVRNPGPGELNWLSLAEKYLAEGIVLSRYSDAFWPFVDDLHTYLSDPVENNQSEAAIIDLSEYVWFAGNNSFEECTPL